MKRLIIIQASILLLVSNTDAQEPVSMPFNGIITDVVGTPIKNARIYVNDSRKYSKTDKKGRFGLTDVKSEDTLHVIVKKQSYLIPVEGKQSIKLRLADQLNYQAEEDQELVDIGYGFVKRREHLGASNGISGDELRKTGRTDLLDALQGKVPGLNISNASANVYGVKPFVNIRGIGSISDKIEPLYIIDGVKVDSFSGLSIYDVDYVEVVKDANIYGVQGGNGAIIVHTKR